jgi:HAE1 family hydrophobic/amphiphilic exporter-1
VLSKKLRYLLVYLAIVAVLGFLFLRLPTSYLPDEDQGILLVQAMLPGNATLEQTQEVLNRVRDHFLRKGCLFASVGATVHSGSEEHPYTP